MTYEEHRNPNLQWGYWLHADGAPVGPPLVDEQGNRWRSVRECFWRSRLGFADLPEQTMHGHLERLLAVLGATARRIVRVEESVYDIFGREREFNRFYHQWLAMQGLVDYSQSGEVVTREGHAALLMLAGTRPSQVRSVPVGTAAIETLVPSDASTSGMNAWLERVEAFGAGLPFAFERRILWGRPGIALSGHGLGEPVPFKRTVWFQSFPDHATRDRFHVWLAVRLDRWEKWGRIAYEKGANHLTQHFLALATIDLDVSGGGDAPASPRMLL